METDRSRCTKVNVVFPMDTPLTQMLFKKYVDDNTMQFLSALKDIMSRHRTTEIAQNFYQYIIKIAMKVAYLYKQKYLTKEQITSLRFVFRRICSTIVNSFRLIHVQPVDAKKIERISDIFTKFKNSIVEMIQPFLRNSSLTKVCLIFDYFASDDFLRFCFTEGSDSFKQVVFVLKYFLDVS